MNALKEIPWIVHIPKEVPWIVVIHKTEYHLIRELLLTPSGLPSIVITVDVLKTILMSHETMIISNSKLFRLLGRPFPISLIQ